MLDNVLRNATIFADGIGMHGAVGTITLPVLTEVTDEHRGGGMDAPVEIALGFEALTASFTIAAYDPRILGLWGLGPNVVKAFTARGYLVGEAGGDSSAEVHMRGRLKSVDPGDWTPGEKAVLTAGLALRYYKLVVGDAVIHEIDVMTGIRIVGGVDQNVAMRRALGF